MGFGEVSYQIESGAWNLCYFISGHCDTERDGTADCSLMNQPIGTGCTIFDPKHPWFISGKRKFKWL